MNSDKLENALELLESAKREESRIKDEIRNLIRSGLQKAGTIACQLPEGADIHMESVGCLFHPEIDSPPHHGAIVSVAYDENEGVLVTINDGETEEDIVVSVEAVDNPERVAQFCLQFRAA